MGSSIVVGIAYTVMLSVLCMLRSVCSTYLYLETFSVHIAEIINESFLIPCRLHVVSSMLYKDDVGGVGVTCTYMYIRMRCLNLYIALSLYVYLCVCLV